MCKSEAREAYSFNFLARSKRASVTLSLLDDRHCCLGVLVNLCNICHRLRHLSLEIWNERRKDRGQS